MIFSPPLSARELKERVDVAAIAGQFTRLRRSGRQLVGLCPLHSERHPSFYVDPEKKVWHCFGCGAGGDVFAFIMRAMGCDFHRSLEMAAEFSKRVARESEPRSGERIRAGVGAKPLCPATRGTLHSQATQESRVRILEALDAANRRLRAIEATNRKARAATATACEPCGENESLLLESEG
jgi:DNA primase